MTRLVIVMLVLLLAGCSSGPDSPPNLRVAGPGLPVAVSTDAAKVGVSYMVSLQSVCLKKRGEPVTVTAVKGTDQAGNLEIKQWGLRLRFPGDKYSEGSDDPGAMEGTFAGLTGFNHDPIATVCGSESSVEVDVNVMPATSLAAVGGFFIYYTQDGHKRRLRLPFSLKFCTAARCPATG
jgi:hypothetical protein